MLSLVLAILLAAEKANPAEPGRTRFTATAFPRVSMSGARITIRAKIVGPVLEAEYCAAIEFAFGGILDRTVSTQRQDCPPWDEYRRVLDRWEVCKDLVVVCPPEDPCWRSCVEPFDLQTEWTWDSYINRVNFSPGEHVVTVTFRLPNGKSVVRNVGFTVGG